MHEAIHVVKDAHLFTYIWYLLGIDIKDFFFVLQTYRW